MQADSETPPEGFDYAAAKKAVGKEWPEEVEMVIDVCDDPPRPFLARELDRDGTKGYDWREDGEYLTERYVPASKLKEQEERCEKLEEALKWIAEAYGPNSPITAGDKARTALEHSPGDRDEKTGSWTEYRVVIDFPEGSEPGAPIFRLEDARVVAEQEAGQHPVRIEESTVTRSDWSEVADA